MRTGKIVFTLLSLLLAGLAGPTQATTPVDGLDDWVEQERQRWNIPGMAVAIVRNDAVVFEQGFGSTRLDDGTPVDSDTLFGIASLSKAFTATALGILVDEGLLDWDDPVVKHMPLFRLSDPWVTANATVRDLLSHRVGVGRMLGNRLQFMTDRPRSELIYRMRYHEFERPFREGYVYSNAMFTVAGELIPAITGQSWDDFLAERLFSPLEMSRSNTRIDDLDRLGNAAWPHQEVRGEVVEIPRRDFDNAGPSAAINSSMADLTRWMRMNLGEPGVYNGTRLVSKEVMEQLHTPSNLSAYDPDERRITAYGLGWGITTYEGFQILQHGGATDGMNSAIALVPELDLGIVMSSNLFNDLRTAVVRRVIDAYADHEPREWGQEKFEEFQEERAEARQAREEKHARRTANTEPSHSPDEFVGEYSDPLYDTVEVLQTGQGLALRFWEDDRLMADLEHWHFDTFRAHWRNPAQREKFVWFTMGESGYPETLHVRFTLRPEVLEEGIYPASYTRTVNFKRMK